MGQAHSISVREQIVSLRASGNSMISISTTLGIPYGTVKKLNKQFQARGHCLPNYAVCGNKGVVRCCYLYYRASLWLKRHHKEWGAPFIHLKLQERYGSNNLPSIRQIQTWFKAQGFNVPRQRQGASDLKKAVNAHDEWQVDAKEQLCLADGQVCTYLSVVDAHSGSSLGATLFPL